MKRVKKEFKDTLESEFPSFYENAYVRTNDQLKGLDTKYPNGALALVSEMMVTENGSSDWFVAARALERITHKHPSLALPVIVEILDREESCVLKDCVSPLLTYLYNEHQPIIEHFLENDPACNYEEKKQHLQSLLKRFCLDLFYERKEEIKHEVS